MKGKAVVDEHVTNGNKYHVYATKDKIYDCTMNQTNMYKNSNKYYIA